MLERMWSKANTHPLLVGIQTCKATMEFSVAVPRQDENQPTSRLAVPLLDIFPKDASSYHRNNCSNVFVAALFTLARNQNNLDVSKQMNE